MWRNEAGLLIGQQRVPLGVIGIIYESRPNVTTDAASLVSNREMLLFFEAEKKRFTQSDIGDNFTRSANPRSRFSPSHSIC